MQYLSPQQIKQYHRDGYLYPLPALDTSELTAALTDLEAVENRPVPAELSLLVSGCLRKNAMYLFPFISKIARNNRVLDQVESILGQNILLYAADFFIKEPQTPHQVTWHQDLTYWGLGETDDQITAWIALTEANTASGCMRFVPGSHKQQIVGHHDSYASDNLLSRGQEISVDVNESDAVHAPLQPGEMSLHHGRLFHASGPNNSCHRRVGLAIRYITPSVKQLVGERDFAMVARGRDDSGHWVHIPIPSCNYEPSAVGLYLQASSEQDKVLMRNTGQAAT